VVAGWHRTPLQLSSGAYGVTATITVDTNSPIPPFEQMRSQLDDAIRSGLLKPGERLPTVRQLAGDLGLAPNTVARAYQALENRGLIETNGRHGTKVSKGRSPTRCFQDQLLDAARQYLEEARHLGATPADAYASLRAVVSAEGDACLSGRRHSVDRSSPKSPPIENEEIDPMRPA
jgi:DNA-binding transcriptional regulator YhcF (GntR family)